MRELRFRAWDKENKEMIYFELKGVTRPTIGVLYETPMWVGFIPNDKIQSIIAMVIAKKIEKKLKRFIKFKKIEEKYAKETSSKDQ